MLEGKRELSVAIDDDYSESMNIKREKLNISTAFYKKRRNEYLKEKINNNINSTKEKTMKKKNKRRTSEMFLDRDEAIELKNQLIIKEKEIKQNNTNNNTEKEGQTEFSIIPRLSLEQNNNSIINTINIQDGTLELNDNETDIINRNDEIIDNVTFSNVNLFGIEENESGQIKELINIHTRRKKFKSKI